VLAVHDGASVWGLIGIAHSEHGLDHHVGTLAGAGVHRGLARKS
jgi:hypothetical protein